VNRAILGGVVVLLLALAFVAYNALFTVHETQQALVLQFGEPRRIIREPGLHAKLPFVQNVQYLDRRILDLDSPAQEVIAADQKRLVVDAFARYRIEDPLRFYQAVGSVPAANNRLSAFMASSVRRVLGESSFQAVVRDERPQLVQRIAAQVNAQAESLGIEVVDVKIRRADLPEANSLAIFQRMETERQQEAAEIRARGEEDARRIRSLADRNVAVLVAEANRDAEQMRGVGDAERNRIFGEAFGRDPDFFSFYRSMQALEASLGGDNTRLVMSPDSELFRFLARSDGGRPVRAGDGGAPAPAGVRPDGAPLSSNGTAPQPDGGPAAAAASPAPQGETASTADGGAPAVPLGGNTETASDGNTTMTVPIVPAPGGSGADLGAPSIQ
jgi:membrane protease subunit HflC